MAGRDVKQKGRAMDASVTNKLDAIPLRVANPEQIPAKRYYDEAFYRLECEHLWPHVWQMACRLEEIPSVGDYVEYRIFDKSVIIVRAGTGVKAFHNACRHRGVELVEGRGNCRAKGLICPFHGWRWDMEGKNTFVFGRHVFGEESLAQAEIDLAPCRVELWGGCAFINFDDDAPPLRECLGPVADRLGIRNVDELKMEWWYATVLPTNWKLAMEAFMEGYHVMRTHPQLHELSLRDAFGEDVSPRPKRKLTSEQAIDRTIASFSRLSDGMAGMIHSSEVEIANSLRGMEWPEDPMAAVGTFVARLKDEIYRRGTARGLPVPDLNRIDAQDPHRTVEFMFPNYFLLPTFSAMSSYRIRPLGPESCLFEIWSLAFLPDDQGRERVVEPVVLPHDSADFPEIPRQDYSNLPRQQRGLHAGRFEYMRLSKKVEGLISNYQRLIDGYLAGLDHDRLTRASQLVNNGFETPIIDIGF